MRKVFHQRGRRKIKDPLNLRGNNKDIIFSIADYIKVLNQELMS